MKQKETIKQKCQRCGYEWVYKGSKLKEKVPYPQYIQCPKCRTTTKLNKDVSVDSLNDSRKMMRNKETESVKWNEGVVKDLEKEKLNEEYKQN